MSDKASFSTPVHTSIDTLWSVLRDKAENPGRYVPGFIESEILEKDSDSMLCRLHTDRFDILERITVDETTHTVYLELLDHPHYTGTLINKIEPELSTDGHPVVTYAYDWQRRAGVENVDDLTDVVQNALQLIKDIAEDLEKETHEQT